MDGFPSPAPRGYPMHEDMTELIVTLDPPEECPGLRLESLRASFDFWKGLVSIAGEVHGWSGESRGRRLESRALCFDRYNGIMGLGYGPLGEEAPGSEGVPFALEVQIEGFEVSRICVGVRWERG